MRRTSTLIIGGALLFAGCGDLWDDGPQAGDPCRAGDNKTCTEDLELLECSAPNASGERSWIPYQPDDSESCECSDEDTISCSIAGFIGIDRAGMRAARRRRAVAAAALPA